MSDVPVPLSSLANRYPILRPQPSGELQELYSDNVGPHGFNLAEIDRIKVPSGGATSWTLATLDGDSLVREFEGIVVAWRVARAYWKVPLSEGGGQKPPDCVSKDGFTGAGDPGGACLQCQFARFGTSSKGAGQACKMVRENLIIMPGQLVPVLLRIPPTSLRPATRYFNKLLSAQINYWAATTRFKLEVATNKTGTQYSRIVFELAGKLSDHERKIMRGYHLRMKGELEGADVSQDLSEDTRQSGALDDEVPEWARS